MGKYNIAVCGAFDVVSYGDSLFPVAIEAELKNRIEEMGSIILFSPKGTEHLYSNAQKVYSYNAFEKMHETYRFNLMIIGGGELLHFSPIVFHGEDGQEIIYGSGELWKCPIDFAQKEGIPYVINSVGVPNVFSKEEMEILRDSLAGADYVSVRDRYSYERLVQIVPDCECVPDSLWNLNRYMKKEPIIEGKYIVFQYGTLFQIDELMSVIQKIRRQTNYQIVVLPINYCHTDRLITEKAREVLDDSSLIYDRQLDVHEIYNIIAGADLFIGTSLHGTLTAQVNGVPSVIFDMYPSVVGKMDGIYDWLAGDIYMISDVNSLAGIVQQVMEQKDNRNEDIVFELKEKTDRHFDRIAQCVYGGIGKNE